MTTKTTSGRSRPTVRLFNTLTRTIEPLRPLHAGKVSLYTCGPTVYDFAHLGNLRTYIFNDTLKRVLTYAGFRVNHVMNVTDVGHLTGDNVGDADVGEDRIEKSAREQGKTAWDIAEFYTKAFLKDLERLNILPPTKLVNATDHIKEMIELVRRLEKKGYTYRIEDGIYFDTSKFSEYGKLSGQQAGRKAGARIEPAQGKRHPSDFALWKFSKPDGKRQMEWDSPWGKGFPGWHIECSAMSMKYLGDTLDIHTGGEDHITIHHPNEIVQSEAATGKPFVRHWLHGYFMTVDGKRMGKSEGNAYTLQELIDRGYDPMAFRYLVLGAHYRTKMNFTWEALAAAEQTLKNVRRLAVRSAKPMSSVVRHEVERALFNDLDTPQALGILHSAGSWEAWRHFDAVLGLGLRNKDIKLTKKQDELILRRETARQARQFAEADRLRQELGKQGILVEDTPGGPRVIAQQ
jgi:cysteinyl-tRNA synthetase